MALSYKTRRWLSVLILLVGLPIYIIFAGLALSLITNRLPILLELLVYFILGIAWVFPFKAIFRGVGKPDPDRDPDSYPK